MCIYIYTYVDYCILLPNPAWFLMVICCFEAAPLKQYTQSSFASSGLNHPTWLCARCGICSNKNIKQSWYGDGSKPLNTSSTAQGGGDFKNRKPIRKVGCWESGKHQNPLFLSLSLSFSLFLSLSLIIYLPTYLPIYLSSYLSIYLSIYLSNFPAIHPSIYPSIHLSIFPSIHLSVYLSSYLCYLFIYLSTYLYIYLSIYPSIYLSIYRSIHPSIHLSTSSFQQIPPSCLPHGSWAAFFPSGHGQKSSDTLLG